jgi:hypothetical protein
MAGFGKNFRLVWNEMMVKATIKRVAMETVKMGGFMIERDAKIIQTPHVDNGRLRASISTNWTGSGLPRGKVGGQAKYEDGIGQPGGSDDDIKSVVGTNVIYAPYVCFGTGIHAEGGGGRKTPWVYKTDKGYFFTHGNVPQPYLRPAYEKNIKQIMAMFKATFK